MVCAFSAAAQNGRISGIVLDQSNKKPLEGASIEVADGKGTTSGPDGTFSLSCDGDMVLKISFVGYETVSVSGVCGMTEQSFSLKPTAISLNQVEVTETSNPNKSQLELPESVVTLEKQEIRRGTGLYLYDALNTNVPGVTMQRRTNSGGQQINIRGYGSGMGFRGVSNNFDMQGVKAYLNGIALTDAEGITMMDDIDFGSVTNAEVLKGPSGTLYGLAIAGVVNLQMQKAPKNKTSVSQDLTLGSYGLLRSTTRVSIGGEKSSFKVNYGHQKFDGFMKHTKSTKDFVNVIGDFDLNKKQSLTTYFGFSDSYDERNGELTVAQYNSFDYSGNSRYIANNAHSAVRTFRAGISHTYKFASNISNTTSFWGSGQSIDQSSAGGWTDKTPVNYGMRSVFNKQFTLSEHVTLSGVTGLEMQKMNAFAAGYRMGPDSTNLSGYNVVTDLRSNQATTNSTSSYFTQWTLALPKGISVNAGVGVSNMSIKLEDRLWAGANNHPGNTRLPVYEAHYKNLVSPSFAINKSISKVASVYASYSVGYKAPVSSNVLIATTGELNTGLKPEKGTQIELGTKGSMLNHKLFYTVAVFNAKFHDKFTTQTVQNPDNTATLYSYLVNGGTLNNQGLEVLVKYEAIRSKTGFISLLRPFANMTYSHFRYDNFKFETIGEDANGNDMTVVNDYSGKAVAGVPPVVFNAGVDMESNTGLYGNVNFNYRSKMVFTSDGANKADAYSLLNAKVGYRQSISNFSFDAYFGAKNITGTQYYNMVFVNQLPDAYIPGPNKLNVFGGASLKYTF